MKYSIIYLFLIFTSFTMNAQMSDVYSALKSGNATALSSHFEDMLEVCILEDQSLYSKAEATSMIAKFFQQNKPSGFKEMHQGSSKGKDSKYTIGQLDTSNGSYRVYIFATQKGNKVNIQEIRFDRG